MSSSILDKLPSLVNISQSDIKSPNNDEPQEKPFILACSRELKSAELELLKEYGKVLIFHQSYVNIPLCKHKFDYAVFNLHEKVHRDTLGKEDLSRYNVVCIVGMMDIHDDFSEDIHAVNCVRTFPQKQPFASDFNRLLLNKKVRAPSILKSIWRFMCFLRDGLQNE